MATPYKHKSVMGRNVRVHRWLMENHIGRKLETFEHVHHLNGDKRDNRIENLEVLNIRDHMRLHHQKHPKTFTCQQCKSQFNPRPGHRGRHPRFCSKKCFGLSRRKYSDCFLRKIKNLILYGYKYSQISQRFSIGRNSYYKLLSETNHRGKLH